MVPCFAVTVRPSISLVSCKSITQKGSGILIQLCSGHRCLSAFYLVIVQQGKCDVADVVTCGRLGPQLQRGLEEQGVAAAGWPHGGACLLLYLGKPQAGCAMDGRRCLLSQLILLAV